MSESSNPRPLVLSALLPTGGLQRGSVVGVAGTAGIASLTLDLLAETLQRDRWGAVVSWPEFGVEAALELGVSLDHLALVPSPGPKWLDVVGALIDSVDLVVLRPSGRVNTSAARRIAGRARERGCVVVVTLFGSTSWPESLDARFVANQANWAGLGRGFGMLSQRLLDVAVDGRRVPIVRTTQLLLPSAIDGTMPSTSAVATESEDGDGFAITA